MSPEELEQLDALLGVLRRHDVMSFATGLEGGRSIQVNLAPRYQVDAPGIEVIDRQPGGWKGGE